MKKGKKEKKTNLGCKELTRVFQSVLYGVTDIFVFSDECENWL